MSESRWLAFFVASFILAITPGPGVTYVVTRTLAQGRRAGLASVLGVALGNFGNGVGAALGLALLFHEVPGAFAIVKLAGAGYLAWLGVQALRASDATAGQGPKSAGDAALVRDGFVVALLNPKTAMFFAAFLPQFVGADFDPARSIGLAATFVAIAACTDAGYATFASAVAPWLRGDRARIALRWLPALVYFALAALALLA